MPELPEIKRFSFIINSNGRGKTFKLARGALALPAPFTSPFRMFAIARGKELRLTLTLDTNPSAKLWVLFTHGLVGRWVWAPSAITEPKGAQLSFAATDGSGVLHFVDVQKMGKWNILPTERWGKDRGADPVDEYNLFRQNILDNRAKAPFAQPIGVLMLDQKYFNGVGNYLRAEILCRAGVSPLTSAVAVFQNEASREKILQLCRLIPMEVLERGLNKYGTNKEIEQFEAWMRCYGKSKGVKDSGGRMMWYFEDQPKHEEPLPVVDEAAYERMFPKSDAAPVSSAGSAPATVTFTATAAAAPATGFSALSFAKPAATISTGSIADHLYEQSWRSHLASEFNKPYWMALMSFLASEKKRGAQIFPPENTIFNALNLCPFESVRVVILGQDPYHDDGQAHGLCFSVPPGVPPPPSLKNIYKELESDIGGKWPNHGTLIPWAQRGVLLLNACLTVEAHKANSHAGRGWEDFTDAVIRLISERRTGVVFILWGGYAQKKGKVIDKSKHCVLEGAHPSPLSVTKFLGCKHFSQANKYLTLHGSLPIDWTLPASAPAQPASVPAPNSASAVSLATGQMGKVKVKQPGSWTCKCCETDNAPSNLTCSSCMVPNPVLGSPSSPFKQATFGATSSLFGSTTSTATSFGTAAPSSPSSFGAPAATFGAPAVSFGATTTATTSFGAPAQAASTGDELVPAQEAVSRMGRMLLLLSTLHKSGMISLEQKNQLKDLAIARDRLVFSAMEAFAADEDRDLLEVADTFKRISKYRSR